MTTQCTQMQIHVDCDAILALIKEQVVAVCCEEDAPLISAIVQSLVVNHILKCNICHQKYEFDVDNPGPAIHEVFVEARKLYAG